MKELSKKLDIRNGLRGMSYLNLELKEQFRGRSRIQGSKKGRKKR